MKDDRRLTVVDEQGANYTLKEEIGSGGQGSVWSTQHENILVKLLKALNSEQREKVYRRLKYVMLREDLPYREIAVPKALLTAPDCGYVMELMDEMVSVAELMKSPSCATDTAARISWYRETGAIRRRVQLLHRLSRILVDLHSSGFVFGDLSPQNIFVSKDPSHNEVQLIDSDNLVLMSESDSRLHTPRYAAPELVRGDSVHTLMTDAYSFAMVAYELLSLHHPLIGRLVDEGEPELEEQAFRGELPWVEDSEDDRNSRCQEGYIKGLPSELVFFRALRNLFEKTFSGNRSPWRRPGMQEWHEALESVLRGFLKCDYCGSYFIFNSAYVCPFCYEEGSEKSNDKRNAVFLRFFRWEPSAGQGNRIRNIKELRLPRMILNKGESIEIPAALQFHNEGIIQFSFEEDTLYLLLKDSEKRRVVIRKKVANDVDEGKARNLTSEKRLPIKREGNIREYCLHLGEIEEPHRVIAFEWGQE